MHHKTRLRFDASSMSSKSFLRSHFLPLDASVRIILLAKTEPLHANAHSCNSKNFILRTRDRNIPNLSILSPYQSIYYILYYQGAGNCVSPLIMALPTLRGQLTIFSKNSDADLMTGKRLSKEMSTTHHHAQNHEMGHAMNTRSKSQRML